MCAKSYTVGLNSTVNFLPGGIERGEILYRNE